MDIGDGVLLLYDMSMNLRAGTRGVILSEPLPTTVIATGSPGRPVRKVLLDTGIRASAYLVPEHYLFEPKVNRKGT